MNDFETGMFYWKLNKFNDAIEYFEILPKKEGDAMMLLGICYYLTGDYPNGKKWLLKVIEDYASMNITNKIKELNIKIGSPVDINLLSSAFFIRLGQGRGDLMFDRLYFEQMYIDD